MRWIYRIILYIFRSELVTKVGFVIYIASAQWIGQRENINIYRWNRYDPRPAHLTLAITAGRQNIPYRRSLAHIGTWEQPLTRPIVVDSAQSWRALSHSSSLNVVGTRTGSDGLAIRHDFGRACTMTRSVKQDGCLWRISLHLE